MSDQEYENTIWDMDNQIEVLKEELERSRKQGHADGYMRSNIENAGAIAILQDQLDELRKAVSNMNPNDPFSVIEVQILAEVDDE